MTENSAAKQKEQIMKRKKTIQLIRLAGVSLFWLLPAAALGQGTINFNPIPPSLGETPNYYEQGFWFRRETVPPGGFTYEGVRRFGGGYNGTPHLYYLGAHWGPEVMAVSRVDNQNFGFVSIELAEPYASPPGSLVPVISVVFNGFRGDGSTTSTTFTTDGLAGYQTFLFDSSFASGLVRVETPSSVWALDNIVFVPEPGVWSLLGLGAVGLAVWRGRNSVNS
jgi:hypothetical protein